MAESCSCRVQPIPAGLPTWIRRKCTFWASLFALTMSCLIDSSVQARSSDEVNVEYVALALLNKSMVIGYWAVVERISTGTQGRPPAHSRTRLVSRAKSKPCCHRAEIGY